MALLTGMTEDGREVPVQVDGTGRLVAEGLAGPAGPVGPQGVKGDTGSQGVKGDTGATGGAVFGAGTAALPGLAPAGDPNTGIYSPKVDTLALVTNGVECARVDSSGRLMLGLSTGEAKLHVGNSVDGLFLDRNQDLVGCCNAAFRKSRGTPAVPTAVVNGDYVGAFGFRAYDGASYITGALIRVEAEGTPVANIVPMRFILSTQGAGSTNSIERVRISSDGKVGIGMNSLIAGSAAKLQCSTTANLSAVATYADNTAAKAGGLVIGDMYRTATGQLMITF